MKVTVITPTWNQVAYIADTIESVLSQTYKDIEYIIIDNESDDGTEEIVRDFMAKDDRIIYVREKDHGQAEAINKGFDRATGDIVCWLNSDDFFYDDKVIETVVRHFEKGDAEIIVGDGWYCDKEKKMTELNPSDRGVKPWVISRWYYIMQPSVFWKKSDIRLDEKFHYVFDWKFFIEMFGAMKVKYTHEPYSVYRMYEDNKTGQDNAKRKKEVYLLQKELGVSKMNTAWCMHVWKQYEKAEQTGNMSLKKRSDFWSRVLFHITFKHICSF